MLIIIDTATIALAAAYMTRNTAIDVVIELKHGIDAANVEQLYRMILSGSHARIIRVVWVEPNYFAIDRKHPLRTLATLLRIRRSLPLALLDSYSTVAGSICSTIMSGIYPATRRVQIEHGTSDYITRHLRGKHRGLSALLRMLHLPAPYFSGEHLPYSLAFTGDASAQHCDFMKVDMPAIEQILAPWVTLTQTHEGSVVLFLPVAEIHRAESNVGDTTPLDDFNTAMLSQHAPPGSLILLKQHPRIYKSTHKVMGLLGKLTALGYKVADIGTLTPEFMVFLPAEALIRYLKVDQLLCTESSVTWNALQVSTLTMTTCSNMYTDFCGDKVWQHNVETMHSLYTLGKRVVTN